MDSTIISIILVMAALTGLLLFLIWSADEKSPKLLESLQSKPFNVRIAPLADPKEPCFIVDDTFLTKYPALREGMKRADEDNAFDFPRDDAVSIISDIPFKHSVTKHQVDSIQDESHTFECIIKYNDRFYDLRIDFAGFNPRPEEGVSIVRITRDPDQFGRLVLKPQNATVWLTFNNTVVWKNELSEKVAIVSDGKSLRKDFDEVATESNIIMPGKIWYFQFLPDWSRYENHTFRYRVEPYSLEGEVVLNWYPRCMSQDVVKSLYSQTKLDVKFPTYLPEGYKYECGVQLFGYAVILTYWNDNWQKYHDFENPSDLSSQNALERGVIKITALRELDEQDEEKIAEDLYNQMKENLPLKANFLRINGHPAISNQQFLSDGRTFSILRVLYDQETYLFQAMIPLEDLIKMAESLT